MSKRFFVFFVLISVASPLHAADFVYRHQIGNSSSGGGGPSGPDGCPSAGDQCSDESYYIGDVGGQNIFVTTSAFEATNITWDDTSTDGVRDETGAQSNSDGPGNVAKILAMPDAADYQAVQYCDQLSAHGHSDWYLPALDEQALWTKDDGTTIAEFPMDFPQYWSSVERSDNTTYAYITNHNGTTDNYSYWGKQADRNVRCVRR